MTGLGVAEIKKVQRTCLCPGCREHREIGSKCACGYPDVQPVTKDLPEPVPLERCRRCGEKRQKATKCPWCGEDP